MAYCIFIHAPHLTTISAWYRIYTSGRGNIEISMFPRKNERKGKQNDKFHKHN